MKVNKFTKRTLALLCALAVIFTALPIISFAAGAEVYTVKAASPAIPMNAGTAVDLSNLEFELAEGVYTPGTDVTVSLAEETSSIDVSGTKISAYATGTYKLAVSGGGKTMNVYAVVKNASDTQWLIYDEAFENNTTSMPAGWSVQMYNTRGWTANYYSNTMNASQQTASINMYEFATFTTPGKGEGNTFVPYDNTEYTASEMAFNSSYQGFIPFQSLWSGNFRANPSFFTLNNDVVKAFSDYTVNVEMLAGSGHYHSSEEGNIYFGVGAFGRAQLNANGMLYNKGTVSSIIYNRAYRVTALQTVDFEAEQADAIKRTKFTDEGWDGANWYNSGEQNVSLKYSGNTITLNGSDVYTASDIAVAKGGVGVVVYGVTSGGDYDAKTNNKQACAKIQHFSVALNNAPDDCPVAEPATGLYVVTQASPAIPVNIFTNVPLSGILFELPDGTTVNGDRVTVTSSNSNVKIANNEISAYAAGAYPVTVTYQGSDYTFYVVAKKSTDSEWYIYNQTFNKEASIPTGWSAQAYNHVSWGIPIESIKNPGVETSVPAYTFMDNTDTSLGGWSQNWNSIAGGNGYITKECYHDAETVGIIPFRAMACGHRGDVPGYFTLTNDIVAAFTDYTVKAQMNAYTGHYPISWSGDNGLKYGVGIYGRAAVASGKLNNTGAISAYSVDTYNGKVALNSVDFANHTFTSGDAVAWDAFSASTDMYAPVALDLAVKYEGTKATLSSPTSAVTFETSAAKGGTGVGVVIYGITAKNFANAARTTASANIKTFKVALNNKANECPKATASEFYIVEKSSPAIPVNVLTNVDLSNVLFELPNGSYVSGSDVTVTSSSANVRIAGNILTAYAKGVTPVTVKYQGIDYNYYVVAKNVEDTEFALFEKDFTKDNSITNWAAQAYYIHSYGDVSYECDPPESKNPLPIDMPKNVFADVPADDGTTLLFCNANGTYVSRANFTMPGVVPFKLGHAYFYQTPAFFTTNVEALKDFTDYTVTADLEASCSEATADSVDYYVNGVGLFGRTVSDASGKLSKNDTGSIQTLTVNTADGVVVNTTLNLQNNNEGWSDIPAKKAAGKVGSAWGYAAAGINTPIALSLSTKYEGSNVTLYSNKDAENATYTAMSSANGGTTVGVVVYNYLAHRDSNTGNNGNLTNSSTNIQNFRVVLNNKANDCPKATSVDFYAVEPNSPAIPMNSGTRVSISSIAVNIGGYYATGSDLTITSGSADVSFDGRYITAAETAHGAYKVTATSAAKGESVELYVVVKNADEEEWVLYEKDFSDKAYTTLPAEWSAQYLVDDKWSNGYNYSTKDADKTPFPWYGDAEIGTAAYYGFDDVGLVLFKNVMREYNPGRAEDNTINLWHAPAYLTLNNAVVNDFTDYTITAELQQKSHYNKDSVANRHGVGLFGRAPVDNSGKLYVTTSPFTSALTDSATGYTYFLTSIPGIRDENTTSVLPTKLWNTSDTVWGYTNKGNDVLLNKEVLKVVYSGGGMALSSGEPFVGGEYSVSSGIAENAGAVGVVVNAFTANGENATEANLKYFKVALNNKPDDCPDASPIGVVYTVTDASPALPMNEFTTVETVDFYVNFAKFGGVVSGNSVTFTAKSNGIVINNDEHTISAYGKGVYGVTATYQGQSVDMYVVVKNKAESEWALFEQDFTANSFTDNWAAQAYYHHSYGDLSYACDPVGSKTPALIDMPKNTFADVPLGDNVTLLFCNTNGTYVNRVAFTKAGVVPFKLGHASFRYAPAFFTTNVDVLKDFTDYTVAADLQAACNDATAESVDWYVTGVGLFGRTVSDASGKLSKNDTKSIQTLTVNTVDGVVVNTSLDLQNNNTEWNDIPVKKASAKVGSAWGYATAGANTVKDLSLSAKYEGSNVTLYSGADTAKETYTVNSAATGGTAVGLVIYDYLANRDWQTGNNGKIFNSSANIQNFRVVLNNKANECPPARSFIVPTNNGITVLAGSATEIGAYGISVNGKTVRPDAWLYSASKVGVLDPVAGTYTALSAGKDTVTAIYEGVHYSIPVASVSDENNPDVAKNSEIKVIEVTDINGNDGSALGTAKLVPESRTNTNASTYSVVIIPNSGYRLKAGMLKVTDGDNTYTVDLDENYEGVIYTSDVSAIKVEAAFVEKDVLSLGALGATIREETPEKSAGLRFGGRVNNITKSGDGAKFETVKVGGNSYEIAEVGSLYCPKIVLDKYSRALEVGVAGVKKTVAQSVYQTTDNFSDITLTITNLDTTYKNVDISFRTYVKYIVNPAAEGEAKYAYEYGDIITRCYNDVLELIPQELTAEDTEDIELAINIPNSVVPTGSSVKVLTTLTKNGKLISTYGNYFVKWIVYKASYENYAQNYFAYEKYLDWGTSYTNSKSPISFLIDSFGDAYYFVYVSVENGSGNRLAGKYLKFSIGMDGNAIISEADADFAYRKSTDEAISAIKSTVSEYTPKYYISSSKGSASNNGTSASTPIDTYNHLAAKYNLVAGDVIAFRCGDTWRPEGVGTGIIDVYRDASGQVAAGVVLTSYSDDGSTAKPIFSGSLMNYANPDYWQEVQFGPDSTHMWQLKSQYRLTGERSDVGVITFTRSDGTVEHGHKIVPKYSVTNWITSGADLGKPADPSDSTVRIDGNCIDVISGMEFPDAAIPTYYFGHNMSFEGFSELQFYHDAYFTSYSKIAAETYNPGDVYVYCSEGNPGSVFADIEIGTSQKTISTRVKNTTFDNLCLMDTGAHAISAPAAFTVDGLTVQNCEFYNIGGSVQDRSFYSYRPQFTQFGNGVEIYGRAVNYTIKGCYFDQIFDAAMTFQSGSEAVYQNDNIKIINNVVEHSNYGLEYFHNVYDGTNAMKNVTVSGNKMWYAGIGICADRPDKGTAAHIKSWAHTNVADTPTFIIENNLFAYTNEDAYLIHNFSDENALPTYRNNRYIGYFGSKFGSAGTYGNGYAVYDFTVAKSVAILTGETGAMFTFVKK